MAVSIGLRHFCDDIGKRAPIIDNWRFGRLHRGCFFWKLQIVSSTPVLPKEAKDEGIRKIVLLSSACGGLPLSLRKVCLVESCDGSLAGLLPDQTLSYARTNRDSVRVIYIQLKWINWRTTITTEKDRRIVSVLPQ